jgi:hypothetical protein
LQVGRSTGWRGLEAEVSRFKGLEGRFEVHLNNISQLSEASVTTILTTSIRRISLILVKISEASEITLDHFRQNGLKAFGRNLRDK